MVAGAVITVLQQTAATTLQPGTGGGGGRSPVWGCDQVPRPTGSLAALAPSGSGHPPEVRLCVCGEWQGGGDKESPLGSGSAPPLGKQV